MTNKELEHMAQIHDVDLAPIQSVTNEVIASLIKAKSKHAAMRGPHEGYAVLLEEVDELWSDVKRDDLTAARKEALHVTAMGLRFLLDVCKENSRNE